MTLLIIVVPEQTLISIHKVRCEGNVTFYFLPKTEFNVYRPPCGGKCVSGNSGSPPFLAEGGLTSALPRCLSCRRTGAGLVLGSSSVHTSILRDLGIVSVHTGSFHSWGFLRPSSLSAISMACLGAVAMGILGGWLGPHMAIDPKQPFVFGDLVSSQSWASEKWHRGFLYQPTAPDMLFLFHKPWPREDGGWDLLCLRS